MPSENLFGFKALPLSICSVDRHAVREKSIGLVRAQLLYIIVFDVPLLDSCCKYSLVNAIERMITVMPTNRWPLYGN